MNFYIIIFMNKIKNITSYTVLFCVGILLMIALFTPVQGNNSYDSFDSNICLSDEEISSMIQQKLLVLDKNEFSIDQIRSYSLEENTDDFYLISLKPTGFMILSSDYNLPPVLAYSFTSNILPDSEEQKIFIDFIKTDIHSRSIYHKEHDNTGLYTSEWQQYLNDDTSIQVNSLIEQWPPEGYSDTEGWLETQWHQSTPFNDLCPLDLDSDERGVAGCPAITMAQILNYHQTVNGVRFNDSDDYSHNYGQRFRIDDDHEKYGFPSFPELNDYLDTIQTHFDQDNPLTDTDKAALIFACGTAATQVYSPQVSGTFGVSQAFEAYEKFNFEHIELLTEEDNDLFDKIIQNMKTGLPVHLAVVNEGWTVGHNLNIDGYNTDDYYHLNFGWGGSYDGWYDLPDELPYELTVIEGVIVDIFASTGSADLSASGSIQLNDVTPGSTVNGSFSIQNIGESESVLFWEIESYPDWGTWQFSTEQGNGLTPEDGEIVIDVSVTVPSKKVTTFSGGIKIVNSESSSDFEVIPLSITTPKTKPFSLITFWMNFLQEYHPILSYFFNEYT